MNIEKYWNGCSMKLRKKMRVCVFGTRGFPAVEGGVEKHCESLYPLVDKDIEIIVFRRKPYIVNNTGSADYPNIRFIDLPSTKIKGFEAVMHSLLATVCCVFLRPNIVHIHNIGPALFIPLLKLFSIPVVLTFHSANYEHKKWGYFAKKLLKYSENVALRFADRIIFVNKFQLEKYSDTIQKKSIFIPNGIRFLDADEQKGLLEKWNIEPEKYILSVGRITPEKGFHTLIEAFCRAKLRDVKLVIAGGVEFENTYMKELQSLATDDSIIFTGYVHGKELGQLYSNARLFVLASENEGFPLVLLEAMSYNRNVLVSDIPAMHLVKLNSNDYFLPGDVMMLEKRLAEKLQEASRRVYELEEYDWVKIAAQVSKIYHSVFFENQRT